jgi:hypothetical protein
LVGIVTGVLTGGITGYFTALYAMRQFKAQRAFDRQLEWYERTARALATLWTISSEVFVNNLTLPVTAFKSGISHPQPAQRPRVPNHLFKP